jgi:enoyl-CoA hydratase/carnithine racemase
MARETVLEERRDGVAILTLNRPRQRNAFNNQMYREMCEALRAARDDGAVSAVVITGAPGAFSAGQDLGEMAATELSDAREHGFADFMNCVIRFDKPILAAVNGVGVGLGLTLLLHCDIVYMAEEARLRPPFVTLGVVPEAASSYLLPAIVGFQRAAEVFYTAEWIDAARALELGIASRVLPDGELLPAVLAKAKQIAAQPLGALRHTKRLLLATREDFVRAARAREDEAFAERVGSPENAEAIQAFFERRPPDFSKVDAG